MRVTSNTAFDLQMICRPQSINSWLEILLKIQATLKTCEIKLNQVLGKKVYKVSIKEQTFMYSEIRENFHEID